MTPEELDRLQTLCDRATDGPWKMAGMELRSDGTGSIRFDHSPTGPDAAFIEAARVALPRLVARVRELEGQIERERESHQQAIRESWGEDN